MSDERKGRVGKNTSCEGNARRGDRSAKVTELSQRKKRWRAVMENGRKERTGVLMEELPDEHGNLDARFGLTLQIWLRGGGELGDDFGAGVEELEVLQKSGQDDFVFEEGQAHADTYPGAFDESEETAPSLGERCRSGQLFRIEPSFGAEYLCIGSPNRSVAIDADRRDVDDLALFDPDRRHFLATS